MKRYAIRSWAPAWTTLLLEINSDQQCVAKWQYIHGTLDICLEIEKVVACHLTGFLLIRANQIQQETLPEQS